MYFNQRLKDLRIERGLKQEDLSDDIFEKYEVVCSPVSISNYERGTRTPGYQTLISLADYFNVSVDYLLGRTENRSDSFIKKKSNIHILDAMNFGKMLRGLREGMELKQEDLSQELFKRYNIECSSVSISNYERGIRTPEYQVLINLANYFDVPVDYLLGIVDIVSDYSEATSDIEKSNRDEQRISTHISDTNYLNIEKRLLDKHYLNQIKDFFDDECIPREKKDKFYKAISIMYLNTL